MNKCQTETLKPSRPGLKVFNPATGLHLKEDGEEVVINLYWLRMKDCGDVVVVKKIESKKISAKNNSEVSK